MKLRARARVANKCCRSFLKLTIPKTPLFDTVHKVILVSRLKHLFIQLCEILSPLFLYSCECQLGKINNCAEQKGGKHFWSGRCVRMASRQSGAARAKRGSSELSPLKYRYKKQQSISQFQLQRC